MNEIGQNIRRERNRRSWTQKYVAQEIGTTEQNVSRWERGQTVPDTYYRQKLSELFGLNAEEFGFFYDEKKDTPESEIHKDKKPEMDASQARENGRTLPPPQAPPQSRWLLRSEWLLIALAVFLVLSLSLIATNVLLITKNLQGSQSSTPDIAKPTSPGNTVDGWNADGNVLNMKTSTDVIKENSHSLKVFLSSRDDSDFPVVRKLLSSSDNIHAGQTISTYIYVPRGKEAIRAWIYALDERNKWWQNTQIATIVPQGIWYPISYTIPTSFHSPAKQIGVQFGSEPLNRESTVYISTMHWSS